MRVGLELLKLTRSAGAGSIFVVGIGRDVGKTMALRAIYSAAYDAGARIGLASCGVGASRKPRLWLSPQTVFVTTRLSLPPTPAAQIIDVSALQNPSGALLYARVISAGLYELAGPPTASGMREVVAALQNLTDTVIVDGAVDRVAALAGSAGAVIVSCGAAAAKTMQEAVDDVSALVERLRVRQFNPAEPAYHLDGALTASIAGALIAGRDDRQIVVGDPTQIALSGKAGSRVLGRLRVRCRHPLRVVAATVASIGPERSFEPRALARAVAAATGLPTFDVYANALAA